MWSCLSCLWKVSGEGLPSGPPARPLSQALFPPSSTQVLGDEPFQTPFPPCAAVTNNHKRGLKQQVFLVSRSGGQKSELKASVALVPERLSGRLQASLQPLAAAGSQSSVLLGLRTHHLVSAVIVTWLSSLCASVSPPFLTRTPVIEPRAHPKSRIISRFFT